MNDLDYMRAAYELAMKGCGKTSPNPMVGAVVVKNNRIVSRGYHARCGAPHAEIVALKQAGPRARGAKLYLTLEPCRHYGRTPPCVDQIISSGIKEVLIGMKDPNPLMNGKSITRLRRAGIKVKSGFMEKELRTLNAPFIKHMTAKRPLVTAKVAQTLDGKTASASGQSKWITSSETRRFSRELRNQFDAILVGIRTVLKDNPGLNAPGKKLKKIVLDSRLRIPRNARLFRGVPSRNCILATTKKAPAEKIRFFKNRGHDVVICPAEKGKIRVSWLLKDLAKREITSILVEGGAATIGSMFKARLVDRMHIFMAPKILGDQRALGSIVGLDIKNLNKAVSLENLKVKVLKQDLFVQGDVVYA